MKAPQESKNDASSPSAVKTLVGALAHAIRNPLAAAIANLEVLDTHVLANDAARQRSARIADDLERIRTAVDDLTEFASPPRVDARPLDLGAWLRDTAPILRVYAQTRGAALRVEAEDLDNGAALATRRVLADPRALRKALLRLIQNSLEAGAREARLAVKITPRGAEITVADRSGAPLVPDVKPFETSKPRNLGLGLTLVRASLEPVGGTLRLEQAAAGETRATLTLRLEAGAAEEATA
jgi:signal transduction histidine kinase